MLNSFVLVFEISLFYYILQSLSTVVVALVVNYQDIVIVFLVNHCLFLLMLMLLYLKAFEFCTQSYKTIVKLKILILGLALKDFWLSDTFILDLLSIL